MSKDFRRRMSGAVWPGQGVAGRVRRRARTLLSRWYPGGSRRSRAPAWRTSRAGTRISRCRSVAIHDLAAADAVTEQLAGGSEDAGELVQPAGDAGGEQRTPHPGGVDLDISRGEVSQSGSELGIFEHVLNRGAVPIPVLHRDACSPVETARLVTINE